MNKMSSQQVQVASLLLQESFGELVEKVGGFLLQRGASNLAEIIRGTELEPTQVATCTQCIYYCGISHAPCDLTETFLSNLR